MLIVLTTLKNEETSVERSSVFQVKPGDAAGTCLVFVNEHQPDVLAIKGSVAEVTRQLNALR